MAVEQIILSETISGAKALLEYGLLGVMAFSGFGFLLWVAYKCSSTTKKGLDNNTQALNGIQIMLAKIEGRLEK